MQKLALKLGFVRRMELEAIAFLGRYDGEGDYLYEAVDRVRQTLVAAITRARAELGEEIDRAEKGESGGRLKERLVEVKGLEMRLRDQECADAEISDFLGGSVERAREELMKGIEWGTKEVYWVRRKQGEGEEEVGRGPDKRWLGFCGAKGLNHRRRPYEPERGDVKEEEK